MLELKNIVKSYKVGEIKQEVLKGIDIKFRKNEFTSILGSNNPVGLIICSTIFSFECSFSYSAGVALKKIH